MKLKVWYLLAVALVGVILICPAMAASPFPDVEENAAYAEAVGYLKDAGIMQGDEKGNFNPDKTVTRAEMAIIICRMLNETENLHSSPAFTDVPVGHWANAYVGKAAEMGIVNGYGNGEFGPNDTVTYAQAVTMVIRAMGLEDLAIEAGGYPNGNISLAEEKGLAGTFSATSDDTLKRWQIAAILFGIYL